MARKILGAVAATAALAFAAQANATVFVLDSITVNAHGPDDGDGLEVQIIDWVDVANGYTIDLGDEDPQYRPLFTLYSDEGTVNAGEDTVAKDITVSFNFSSPDGDAGTIGGETNGVRQKFFFATLQYGTLTWKDPDAGGPLGAGETYFNWGSPGNLGVMKISLINLPSSNFGAGPIHGPLTGTLVKAKFDWEVDPQAVAVPEPGTWALMIGGFGLAGATLRRRRALAA